MTNMNIDGNIKFLNIDNIILRLKPRFYLENSLNKVKQNKNQQSL